MRGWQASGQSSFASRSRGPCGPGPGAPRRSTRRWTSASTHTPRGAPGTASRRAASMRSRRRQTGISGSGRTRSCCASTAFEASRGSRLKGSRSPTNTLPCWPVRATGPCGSVPFAASSPGTATNWSGIRVSTGTRSRPSCRITTARSGYRLHGRCGSRSRPDWSARSGPPGASARAQTAVSVLGQVPCTRTVEGRCGWPRREASGAGSLGRRRFVQSSTSRTPISPWRRPRRVRCSSSSTIGSSGSTTANSTPCRFPPRATRPSPTNLRAIVTVRPGSEREAEACFTSMAAGWTPSRTRTVSPATRSCGCSRTAREPSGSRRPKASIASGCRRPPRTRRFKGYPAILPRPRQTRMAPSGSAPWRACIVGMTGACRSIARDPTMRLRQDVRRRRHLEPSTPSRFQVSRNWGRPPCSGIAVAGFGSDRVRRWEFSSTATSPP